MRLKKNATEEAKPVAEDSCTQTETSMSFEEACKKFRERWEQMSEVERNRIAEVENPISPEEEKYIHEEAIRTWERIERRNAIYKHGEEAVTRNSGMGMKDIIAEFKTGRFVFVDANALSDKDWAKFNKVLLWDRESVRFVPYQDKMRLTQVVGSDKYAREHYRIWHPNSSKEEQKKNLKKQDEEFMAREKEMLENPLRETYPCKGFDLPTAEEAHEHFWDKLTELIDYEDYCNGHRLSTGFEKGKRILCRCSECGGLILVQKNVTFDYISNPDYDDFFPVRSHWEADQLNNNYDGNQIELEWKGKWLSLTRNKVTGHNWDKQ